MEGLTKIEVKLRLTEPMLGTVPKNPTVYATYIESKKPESITEDEAASVEKIEEKGWTGFHHDETTGEIFIYDYMIRGFLKNAALVLKDVHKVKAPKSKIDNLVFVLPRRIMLGKTHPDGVVERPLRAMTMQGPRVTLARSDYLNAGLEISFTITLLSSPDVTPKFIEKLFEYGALCGLGQFRNGSYGRFEVVSFEKN